LIDVSAMGVLSPKDIRKAMEVYGSYCPNKQMVFHILSEFDEDLNGEIQFDEFVKMLTMKPCEKDTEVDIRTIFNDIDWDIKGKINLNDLR